MVSTFDFHWNDLVRNGKFANSSSNIKQHETIKRERVDSNYFTSGIGCASLIKSTVIILNDQKENGMVPTTNRTYPWLYVIPYLGLYNAQDFAQVLYLVGRVRIIQP